MKTYVLEYVNQTNHRKTKAFEFKPTNDKERILAQRKAKERGYKKTADCMWVQIYTKGNCEIIITKDY